MSTLAEYRVHTGVDVALVDPFASRLLDLLESFAGRVLIVSGRRSYAEQQVLWLRYLAGGNLAARPGTSNHERGAAADLRIVAEGVTWAEVHAAAAARGLRFPIASEVWHIEPDPAWVDPPAPEHPSLEDHEMPGFQLVSDDGNTHTFLPGQRAISMGGLPEIHGWLHRTGIAPLVNAGAPVPTAEVAAFVSRWNGQ